MIQIENKLLIIKKNQHYLFLKNGLTLPRLMR